MGKKLADEGDEVRIKVIWPDSCASCSELSGVTLTTPQSTIVNHYQPFLTILNHSQPFLTIIIRYNNFYCLLINHS